MERALFDWNRGDGIAVPAADPAESGPDTQPWLRFGGRAAGVKLVDETLRDGLQSVSGVNPPVSYKVDLLHGMTRVGVNVVSVGLPAAGQRHFEDTRTLCKEIVSARLPLIPTAAARTVVADVEGIARAADGAGIPIEVYSFIGSSPIRHLAEGWTLDFLVRSVRAVTEVAVKAGLPFCLVTEDTTRSHPDVLRALFRAAVDAGASRLCLCDTTGHVTPYGVAELIAFARRELAAMSATGVDLDWHAHNDRGLSVATALWAASNGVGRIHGTGLGIGERVGNSCLELLVENLGLLGARPRVPRERLVEYCQLAARALSWTIPPDHPIAGARFLDEQRGDRSYRIVQGAAPPPPAEQLVPMTLRLGSVRATPARGDGDPTQVGGPGGAAGGPVEIALAVPPRRTLLEALRYDLDLIGTKQGCDKGDCGACTVILDGEAVLSCLTLALDADGRHVMTVEMLDGAPHIDPLLECFDRVGGGQCGFCTPGMLMSTTALLDKNPRPTRDEIKLAISGNLCRCTGYGKIVDAVELAAQIRRGEAEPATDLPGAQHGPPPLPSNTQPRAPRPANASSGPQGAPGASADQAQEAAS